MSTELDATYATIMSRIVETSEAPHFTEVAADLGVSVDEGLRLVNEVIERTPGWMHPGTDYIASFPPFNVQPTQYRISIDGKPGWYGQ